MSPSPSSFLSKKTKILFYHTNNANLRRYWVYSASLHLKTHIDLNFPDISDQLEWLLPIQKYHSDQELVDLIDTLQPDIVCTSHYIWNHMLLMDQFREVKKLVAKKFILIAGGPSINPNDDSEFFAKFDFVDFAVYGPGEQAFGDIIASLITQKKLIAFNTSNCAWVDKEKQKTIVAPYKFVPMSSASPYLHNRKLFSEMVKAAQNDSEIDNPERVNLAYTLTRGCPYSCTFCDWNSGLGNKVSRRKNTYKEEIDLFHELGLYEMYLSDANVGQYDEDIDMVAYFGEKNTKQGAQFRLAGNFSKLRKDANLKIWHTMAQNKLLHPNEGFNFSVQDTNQQVLENIDRPDVGWDKHVEIAQDLRMHYPNCLITVQIIFGLPGQTVASWRQTLRDITKQNMLPRIFINEPLPASPAMYDPEYQEKFQYEYVETWRVFDLYLAAKETKVLLPKKCFSFDQRDIAEMSVTGGVYQILAFIQWCAVSESRQPIDIEYLADAIIAQPLYRELVDDLYNNWVEKNSFTVNNNIFTIFDRPSISGESAHLFAGFVFSQHFFKLLLSLARAESKSTIAYLYFKKIIEKKFLDYGTDF